MGHYPKSITALIQSISMFPGIGVKTAERLAMHLLRAPQTEAETLAGNILTMKERVRLCAQCSGLSDSEICQICSDPSRDSQLLCVVEQPADMIAIEKASVFSGLYHILQGVLSPIDGIGPDRIRIGQLLSRVSKGSIREIVLATGTSVEGEATASYIAEKLACYPVDVSRIATGVPVGGDLKFIDQMTLKRAMEKRHGMGKNSC